MVAESASISQHFAVNIFIDGFVVDDVVGFVKSVGISKFRRAERSVC